DPSARQRGRSRQELVDRARALTPFANRPDYQRLAAAHVASREHLPDIGGVATAAVGGGFRIAARVLVDAECLEHLAHRRYETHREQYEVGRHLELGSRHFDHLHLAARLIFLPLDTRRHNGPDIPLAVVDEAL